MLLKYNNDIHMKYLAKQEYVFFFIYKVMLGL